MSQVWIPLGGLLFLALLVYAFVREARRQRSAARRLYEEFAGRKGWRFDPLDDDTVQRRTTGMEAIGSFESPSLGAVVPKNVVSGTVPEGRVWLYEHSRRIAEGEVYHWHVCLIETDRSWGPQVVMRINKDSRAARARNRFYTGEELPLPAPLGQQVVMYMQHPEQARRDWPADLPERLLEAGRELPSPVDVQIRGECVAVYPAGRNSAYDSPDSLEQLLEFSLQLVRLLRMHDAVAVG